MRIVPPEIDSSLFEGLSVYQDVVVDGQTVQSGRRDCLERFRLIEPWLPPSGPILDIGSNFGWFGLQVCLAAEQVVVASVEADPKSARVQRAVLESHRHERIHLLQTKASKRLIARFARNGQRFEAVLCLSVLHWIRKPAEFLAELARISGRILIEYPDPAEAGSGISSIRDEIGEIGPFLRRTFLDREVHLLGHTASHRSTTLRREMWLVERPQAWPAIPQAGLSAFAVLESSPRWPDPAWWRSQSMHLAQRERILAESACAGRLLVTPNGLTAEANFPSPAVSKRLDAIIEKLPPDGAPTRWEKLEFRVRRLRDLVHRMVRRRDK